MAIQYYNDNRLGKVKVSEWISQYNYIRDKNQHQSVDKHTQVILLTGGGKQLQITKEGYTDKEIPILLKL